MGVFEKANQIRRV